VTAVVLAGAMLGIGLWLAWTGLRPAPEPLGVALARIERPADGAVAHGQPVDRDTRVGRYLLRHLPPLARAVDAVAIDLRIVGRTPEEQAARVGSYAVLALVVGPWTRGVFWVLGLDLPPLIPGAITLIGVGFGVLLPFTSLRAEAAARRTAFAHALSSWCDVTVMTLAAGRGVEQAMETAAKAGRGWVFAELRAALRAGYVRGEPPWESLRRLGTDLGIPDLTELASTIAMAGEEGAAVRETVAAKARTIRERITADTEVAAVAVTERMGLPSVLLVMGFMVFLGYPAVVVMLSST
jgi:Flp pilus assembly protein TadB